MREIAEPMKMSKVSNDFGGADATSTPRAVLDRSRPHRVLLGSVCALAFALACGTASAGVAAFHQFDGTYRGNSSLVKGWGYVCGTSDLSRSLVVANGGFDFPFQIDRLEIRRIPVEISAEGSFTASLQYGTGGESSAYISRIVTITGHINGQTLQATVSDLDCTRNIVLRRT
jgi:hypothetical protein